MANVRSLINAELLRIHDENGELLPETVVEEATPRDSVLHNSFEWDNTKAGHKYRLQQAAELIRVQRIEYARDKRGSKTVRQFISLYESGSPNRGGYRLTEEVVQDPLSAAIVLRNLERAIADLKRQYGHLKEFAQILRDAAA